MTASRHNSLKLHNMIPSINILFVLKIEVVWIIQAYFMAINIFHAFMLENVGFLDKQSALVHPSPYVK